MFGDSYSDNGNTYLASKNTYPGRAYYFGHFLDGLNIRDLQLSPLAKQLSDKYKNEYIHKLNEMISNYNGALVNKYKQHKDIIIYNIYKFDQEIFNTNTPYRWYRQTFKLKEKTTPCYKNTGNYVDQVGKVCNKPWEYLFYDRIHQTTFINKLLSDNLFFFLYKNHWRFTS